MEHLFRVWCGRRLPTDRRVPCGRRRQALLLTLGSIPAAMPLMFVIYGLVGGAWLWAVTDLRKVIGAQSNAEEQQGPETRRAVRATAGNSA